MTNQDYQQTLSEMVQHACSKHPEILNRVINGYRLGISEVIWNASGKSIGHGLFKGLKLSDHVSWASGDRAAMALGLYELEVLNLLSDMRGQYRCFIDIGAADGYYALGALVSGLTERVVCFEMTSEGRDAIQENARLNGVSARIQVFGEADAKFYELIDAECLSSSILFIDAEGAEFDILTPDAFRVFRHSPILVELHDWFFSDGAARLGRLMGDAQETHDWQVVVTGGRDLSQFPELYDLNDTARWLICSEGRGRLMSWAYLRPKVV